MNFTSTRSLLALACGALVSCSSVKSTISKVGDPIASLAKNQSDRLKRLRLSSLGSRRDDIPPVVKIRRSDLREVQLGSEKVLAWTRSKELGGGVVYFPVDFDPSKLPSSGPVSASGILPPLQPADESEASLPADAANLPDLTSEDFTGGSEE